MNISNGRSSFVTLAGWSQHRGSTEHKPTRGFGHLRSLSSITQSSGLKTGRAKSSSVSGLPPSMATEAIPRAPFGTPQPSRMMASMSPAAGSLDDDQHDLTTLPDPRSRAMSPALPDGALSPDSHHHHPDLNDEVATLSTKLINAINHQTSLDDTLSHTRMELEEAKARIRELEEQTATQREMLAGDVWIRRKTVEAEKTTLLSRVADEKKARQDVEQQKKKMEQELENLTAALFEEANKMVITAKEEARTEHEALQRKNDLLRSQLADAEGLLKSQQEQLAELKQVMEEMSAERDDQTALTTPSSPGFSKLDAKYDDGALSDGAASQAGGGGGGVEQPISPSYPTSFTQLLQPVLRTDLSAYEDFVGLVRTTKRRSVHSRPPSGTHSSFAALGLSLGSSPLSNNNNNGSATSLSATNSTPVTGGGGGGTGSSPQSPNTPATAGSGSSSTTAAGGAAGGGGGAATHVVVYLPPLKDTKFYKRVLAEDIEPTLRLDTAPGLSWLARRSVLQAMTEGTLVVEPVPLSGPFVHISKPLQYPCSLCGDSRKDDDQNLRRHRFRTSESESAQRYPLCRYCLGRVRSTCDFLGFLRIVKDGHWRADDEDAERAAWEESVRLREQMFWSRIGGGVVPTTLSPHDGSRAGHHAAGLGGGLSRSASVRSPKVGNTGGGGGSPEVTKEADAKTTAVATTTTSATAPAQVPVDPEQSANPKAVEEVRFDVIATPQPEEQSEASKPVDSDPPSAACVDGPAAADSSLPPPAADKPSTPLLPSTNPRDSTQSLSPPSAATTAADQDSGAPPAKRLSLHIPGFP